VAGARPIVKYVGGKTRLLPELVARMPKTYGRYFEPFVGGGALFFHLAPARAVLGDMNGPLVRAYRALARDVDDIIDHLKAHKYQHAGDDAYYYAVRSDWNARRWDGDVAGEAAAFIYLNKTCFNGLWRVNRKGAFNVPRGDYADPPICDEENLRAAALALARAEVKSMSYQYTCNDAEEGDFAYLDPPYDPISDTSNFTAYTNSSFGKDQQLELANTARMLRARGVSVMLSNNDTPFVRGLYQDFCVDNVKCGRSVNSKATARGKVDEVIITSYERTS
jgi:DNA adenine methylase